MSNDLADVDLNRNSSCKASNDLADVNLNLDMFAASEEDMLTFTTPLNQPTTRPVVTVRQTKETLVNGRDADVATLATFADLFGRSIETSTEWMMNKQVIGDVCYNVRECGIKTIQTALPVGKIHIMVTNSFVLCCAKISKDG